MCGCLSHAPYWGPGPQPRHVFWLGIDMATLWFTGQHSIHWATPARAVTIFLFNPCASSLIYFLHYIHPSPNLYNYPLLHTVLCLIPSHLSHYSLFPPLWQPSASSLTVQVQPLWHFRSPFSHDLRLQKYSLSSCYPKSHVTHSNWLLRNRVLRQTLWIAQPMACWSSLLLKKNTLIFFNPSRSHVLQRRPKPNEKYILD